LAVVAGMKKPNEYFQYLTTFSLCTFLNVLLYMSYVYCICVIVTVYVKVLLPLLAFV